MPSLFDFIDSELCVLRDFDIYNKTRNKTNNFIFINKNYIYLSKNQNLLDYERQNLRTKTPAFKNKEEEYAYTLLHKVIPAAERTRLIEKCSNFVDEKSADSLIGSLLPGNCFIFKNTIYGINEIESPVENWIMLGGKKYQLFGHDYFKLPLEWIKKRYNAKLSIVNGQNLEQLISSKEFFDDYTKIGFKISDKGFFAAYKVDSFIIECPHTHEKYKLPDTKIGVRLEEDWKGRIKFDTHIVVLEENYLHPAVNGTSACVGNLNSQRIIDAFPSDIGKQIALLLRRACITFKEGYQQGTKTYSHISDSKFQGYKIPGGQI
ncbi:hypothetical protein J4468_01580 [Candidatus Woesearchaeota archaeon]|nr:hypothetical protein [Candidatus Woesearchaeota archaeon]